MEERTQAREAASERPARSSARVLEELRAIGIAVAIALVLRVFVVDSFYVPSESMLPTLLVGDHIWVNKHVYGPKVPFLDLRLPGWREPLRGEIAVFEVGRRGGAICPVDRCPPGYPVEDFVKRIVGLPGDRIEIREDGVVVNGELLETSATGASFTDDDGTTRAVHREELGRCVHELLRATDGPRASTHTSVTVEPGRYFVMGDNRGQSNDSRYWGTVRREELKGPAFVLYWSWNNRGSWADMLNPLHWWRLLRHETRWSRIGDTIDCREQAGSERPEAPAPRS